MKITITPTKFITEIEGVKVRLWDGLTNKDVRCKVFVHQIAVPSGEEQEEFDEELQD